MVFFAALAARDTSILSDLSHRSPISSSFKGDDDHDGHSSFVDTLFQLLGIVVPKNDPLLLVSSKCDIDSGLIKKTGVNKRDLETVCTCPEYYSYTHLKIGKDNISNHTLEIPFVFSRYPGSLIHSLLYHLCSDISSSTDIHPTIDIVFPSLTFTIRHFDELPTDPPCLSAFKPRSNRPCYFSPLGSSPAMA